MTLGLRQSSPAAHVFRARLREDVVARAKQEAGLRVKLDNRPVPTSPVPATQEKIRRMLRYYRRWYRPQRDLP